MVVPDDYISYYQQFQVGWRVLHFMGVLHFMVLHTGWLPNACISYDQQFQVGGRCIPNVELKWLKTPTQGRASSLCAAVAFSSPYDADVQLEIALQMASSLLLRLTLLHCRVPHCCISLLLRRWSSSSRCKWLRRME
jgi:hypothetical protein